MKTRLYINIHLLYVQLFEGRFTNYISYFHI